MAVTTGEMLFFVCLLVRHTGVRYAGVRYAARAHTHTHTHTHKVLSRFYQEFLLLNPNNSGQIKERWEVEMQQEISKENWELICSEAHLVTSSNTWREFRWKVLTRFFRTPHIVAKMGPTHSNKCWRSCGAHIGNHLHIFWACPKLRPFWDEVYKVLAVVFHVNIPKDPLIAVLGVKPQVIEGRATNYLLQILLTAAIKCITINWLKPEPPTYDLWTQKVLEIYEMERITFLLRLQKHKFDRRWSPILSILMQ